VHSRVQLTLVFGSQM